MQLGGSSSSSSRVPEVAAGADLPVPPSGPPVDEPAQPPDTAGGQARAELVSAFSAAAHRSDESRRLYKRLWMRMSRTMTDVTSKAVLTAAEVAFRDAPGALVSEERMAAWLRLADAAEPLARIGGAQRPGAGRPSIGSFPGQQSPRWLRESSALLTWNGDWGVFTSDVDAGGTPDDVAERLRTHPRSLALRSSFEKFLAGKVSAFRMRMQWAFCFEVSPQSLAGGVVRVHVHAMLFSIGGKRRPFTIERASDLSFQGCAPMLSGMVALRAHARANQNLGLFYVLVQKVGGVFSAGTVELYKDVLVNPDWAFNLLQQGKITPERAHEVIVACAKNVPRLLANLDGYRRAKQALVDRAALEAARAAVSGAFRPFQVVPEVACWLRGFSIQRDRYPFLILEGPSRLGKTQYAESLAPPGRTLNIDCASATEPDLRQYRSEEVDSIIFDEAKAAMVIRAKRLFQAPMGMVNLGMSATNCNAYQVMVHRKRLIVCSNTWSDEVLMMSNADAAWLTANAVHVRVRGPLWLVVDANVELPVEGGPSPADRAELPLWTPRRRRS